MEKQTRKRLDYETKQYILRMVLEEGANVSDLAFKFEIGRSTIQKWLKDARQVDGADPGGKRYVTTNDVNKLKADYEKKVRDLEEENAI
ncbi:MAG: transposase, partial [Solibacillus sp.]